MAQKTDGWVSVDLPGESFRLRIEDGQVVGTDTAVARWTIGKPALTVLDYFHRHGARIRP